MNENSLPGVDIIIPCYNLGNLAVEAIESALTQTYSRVGIIFVDDGSTDSTPDIARRFGDRIRYVRTENAGVSAARNSGIRLSGADFLLFLDADDYLLPDTIEKFMGAAISYPTEAVFHSAWQTVDMERQLLFAAPPPDLQNDAFHSLLFGLNPPPNSILIPRRFFERFGMFDEQLRGNEDWDMWLRVAAGGIPFIAVPEATVVYRRRPGSLRSNLRVQNETYHAVLNKRRQLHAGCKKCKNIKRQRMEDWRNSVFFALKKEFADYQSNGRTTRGIFMLLVELFQRPSLFRFLCSAGYRRLLSLLGR